MLALGKKRGVGLRLAFVQGDVFGLISLRHGR
jgi:hypothetical protein